MKVADLDFFKNKNYHSLNRINPSTTLVSGVYELTSGYVKSMIILIDFMTRSELFGGKVLIALDICQIYDEDIEKIYNQCGRTPENFIEYLNEKMSNL